MRTARTGMSSTGTEKESPVDVLRASTGFIRHKILLGKFSIGNGRSALASPIASWVQGPGRL